MKNLKTIVITACIALPLGFAAAGPLKGHPNLQAAQTALETATTKIGAAQTANEFDMDGHAQKAKDAIATALSEVKLAGAAATANAPKK
jgi:hypothetical protein